MNQEQKIKTAITELIDQVERFSAIAPLSFIDVDGAIDDIGGYTFPKEHKTRFNRFESSFQHLLETLDPYVHEDEEKVKAAEKIIDALIPEDNKEARWAWCQMRDALGMLAYPAQRVGFYAGVFVGAKQQGASREDLVKIGKALADPCVQRWNNARRSAEYKAKKEAEAKKSQQMTDRQTSQKKIDKAAKVLAHTVKDLRKVNGKGGRR